MVRARLAEVEELRPGWGTPGPEFWDTRAHRFADEVGTGEHDPFFLRVRRRVGERTRVLDVGAGTGRFALPLAEHAAEVVAVDSSRAMLDVLEEAAERRGLDNIRCVHAPWEEATGLTGDVAICSYVIPKIAAVAGFLRKLDAAARRAAFIYMNAISSDWLLDAFWRHFHGHRRRPSPTYLDAVTVLGELGISPEVEVVEIPLTARFENVGAAVDHYAGALLLDDSPAVREKLARLLADWLVRRDGQLSPPVRSRAAAIISWT